MAGNHPAPRCAMSCSQRHLASRVPVRYALLLVGTVSYRYVIDSGVYTCSKLPLVLACMNCWLPWARAALGQVYRARDTRLGRDVALKLLPHGFANDPDRLARFEREARAIATLAHTNIRFAAKVPHAR